MQEKEKLQESEVKVIKFEESSDVITGSNDGPTSFNIGAEDPKNTPDDNPPPAIPFG